MTYEEALQKRILDRVGMDDSGYDRHSPVIEKRADGYEKGPEGYSNTAFLDMSIPFSAGAMYSTVEDLYLWDRALYGDRLLLPQYKEIMFTPFLNGYACGWGVGRRAIGGSDNHIRFTSHGGGINGFNTLIVRLLDDQNLVVLLNNTGGTRLEEMSTGIINILYGQPYDLPKRSIAEEIYQKLMVEDLDRVIRHYQIIREKRQEEFHLNEAELNNLGYRLLSQGRIDEAIAIFQQNVQAFPESSNVYDSLGEAFMEKGNRKAAIRNYEKSLELDPDNTNAVEMLKKLGEK